MATEWNGEGIPPVGAECEATWGGKAFWRKAVILSCSHIAVDHLFDGWGIRRIDEYEGSMAFEFRPLQSKEQKQVAEIAEILMSAACDKGTTKMAEYAQAIYNAGFRKVVE